jgi:hypothetical protein
MDLKKFNTKGLENINEFARGNIYSEIMVQKKIIKHACTQITVAIQHNNLNLTT